MEENSEMFDGKRFDFRTNPREHQKEWGGLIESGPTLDELWRAMRDDQEVVFHVFGIGEVSFTPNLISRYDAKAFSVKGSHEEKRVQVKGYSGQDRSGEKQATISLSISDTSRPELFISPDDPGEFGQIEQGPTGSELIQNIGSDDLLCFVVDGQEELVKVTTITHRGPDRTSPPRKFGGRTEDGMVFECFDYHPGQQHLGVRRRAKSPAGVILGVNLDQEAGFGCVM